MPYIREYYGITQNLYYSKFKKDYSTLLNSSAYLQNNPEFLIKAFDQNKTILRLVPKKIKEQNKEFCLGVISVCTRKREELQKKLNEFLIKNEIYHDCKDTIEEDSSDKDSVKKKQIPLELFYAYTIKPDFNPTLNLLEDIFEKNNQTQKELSEQTNRLQIQNVKLKKISGKFSDSNELYKEMESTNNLYKIPGYILKGTNTLLNQGFMGLRFLISKTF